MGAVADDILELQRAFDDAELHGDAARLSQVWVQQPGGWRLAAIQFSTLGTG